MTICPPGVTLLAAPSACPVCGGAEQVRVISPVGVDGPRTGPVIPCLACCWRLPIWHLPMRGDR